ncbi:UNVERIFIED_CONTAM: hypothetical protein Slati_0533800 [Sesamum latifolium]|uniref:Integrase zinc-binding domain-containing protein n=1 Tax=Sesamum latifolium TaxID=2727402 RepID=A0AAW2XZ11_9LAMI
MGWLGDVELEHLLRRDNKQADVLAKLASTLSMTDKEAHIPICKSWVIPPIFSDDEDATFQEEENHVMEVFKVEEEDWRQPLADYLKYGKLPNDPRWRTDTDSGQFVSFITKALYRRSFDGIFSCCLSDDEKVQAMEETHSEIYGAHKSGPKLHFRIKEMGYYWPTMVKDCMDYAKRCQACQFHINLIHQPPEPLHPTVVSWHFDAWGWNIVGPMTKSSGGLAEAFNKTLCSLLKKVVAKSKRDWHERIGEALWAYRTTIRTPTQSTSYALVYRVGQSFHLRSKSHR